MIRKISWIVKASLDKYLHTYLCMYVCMYVPTWLVLEISSNAKPLTRLKEHMESRTISIAKIVNLYPLLEVNANLMLALTPSRIW